jgi:hypothetical protein
MDVSERPAPGTDVDRLHSDRYPEGEWSVRFAFFADTEAIKFSEPQYLDMRTARTRVATAGAAVVSRARVSRVGST